jgi:hypothetical protein
MHTKLCNSAVLMSDDRAPAHADDCAADAKKEAALRKRTEQVSHRGGGTPCHGPAGLWRAVKARRRGVAFGQ